MQGSNLGLISFGKAEIPLSLASIPSMNFFVSASIKVDGDLLGRDGQR
jgi:hypothetical protein